MTKAYAATLLVLSLIAAAVACSTDTALTQPPPPALAADPDRILQPDTPTCETQCVALGESYEKCSASVCAPGQFPLLAIRAVDSADKHPGDRLEIGGQFGAPSDRLSLALAVERDGVLYHRYRLQTLSWENARLLALIHAEVSPDAYQLLLVYQINSDQMSRPIYMQGSNTTPLRVSAP